MYTGITFIRQLFFLLAIFFIVQVEDDAYVDLFTCVALEDSAVQDVVSADDFCLEKDGTLQRVPSIQRVRKLEPSFIISFNGCSTLHETLNEDAQILKNLFFTKRSFWCIYRL